MRNLEVLAGLWVVAWAAPVMLALPAAAQDDQAIEEANQAFFAGVDMKRAGDCEGAIARFQLALSRNGQLIQARLYEAECYQQLDMGPECVRSAAAYLEQAFDGAETDRAKELYQQCGGDPGAMPAVDGAQGDAGQADGGSEGESTATGPLGHAEFSVPGPVAVWSVAVLEFGAVVEHIDNTAGLTAVGPLVGVRLLPARFLELGFRGRVGFGPYNDAGGTVTVPEIGVSAAASIPIGRSRLVIGAAVPLAFTGYGGKTYVDPGVLAEVGVRVAVQNTRLVVGGLLEGGYLVRPVIGASMRLGLQLGKVGSR